MRILLIVGSYPPMKCGVGSYTQRLARALAQLTGVAVTVLTDERASGAEEYQGVEVLPVMRGWRLTESFAVSQILKRTNPDVVHVQYPSQGYSGSLAIRLPGLLGLLGKRCVQTWHEPMLGRAGLWLAAGLATLIVVKKDMMAHVPMMTRIGLVGARIQWIPGASLIPTITLSDHDRQDIRRRYASEGEMLLVYFGFVAPLKGMESLFEVVATINAHLVLVCDFDDGNSYHQTLLHRIATMGIASRITIAGYLPDDKLARVLAASDAAIFPFKEGAHPWNTTIDAATAQGVFVLTTSSSEVGYNQNRNIYFAKPGDVTEMVSALHRHSGYCISRKPSLDAWATIAKQHLEIYSRSI